MTERLGWWDRAVLRLASKLLTARTRKRLDIGIRLGQGFLVSTAERAEVGWPYRERTP